MLYCFACLFLFTFKEGACNRAFLEAKRRLAPRVGPKTKEVDEHDSTHKNCMKIYQILDLLLAFLNREPRMHEERREEGTKPP